MQHVVDKLKSMIKSHYGLESELEIRSTSSYQTMNREFYNPTDQCLSVPIYDPGNEHIIAFFKVNNISQELSDSFEKINDLVTITLQTYVNLLNKHEITKNLVYHLQTEIHPNKVIPLHKQRRLQETSQVLAPISDNSFLDSFESEILNKELLIHSNPSVNLIKLVMQMHESSKNSFFLHLSHMSKDFLNSVNDLINLENTTLFIEELKGLSLVQKKTLETYFLVRKSTSLLVIAGTAVPLKKLAEEPTCEHLLRHFHYFHLLTDKEQSLLTKRSNLEEYAQAILGMSTSRIIPVSSSLSQAKSHNLVPCIKDLFPTIH